MMNAQSFEEEFQHFVDEFTTPVTDNMDGNTMRHNNMIVESTSYTRGLFAGDGSNFNPPGVMANTNQTVPAST